MPSKLYLEPGSINCMCCPDIPTCRNIPQAVDDADLSPQPETLGVQLVKAYDDELHVYLHNTEGMVFLGRVKRKYLADDMTISIYLTAKTEDPQYPDSKLLVTTGEK